MSIHTLNRIFYVTTGVLVSLLGVFAVLLFFGQRELKSATSLRYESYLLADELRQSSDDLTRTARTFVVTGDFKFERMYWEILVIRNGEASREAPRTAAISPVTASAARTPRITVDAAPARRLVRVATTAASAAAATAHVPSRSGER